MPAEFATVSSFIGSVKDLGLSFYGGVSPADIELLSQYKAISPPRKPERYTDAFGVIINPKYLHLGDLSDTDTTAIPFPSDGIHAEAIEYVGVVRAFHEALEHFVAVEVGCGWGPWLGLAGVLALRHGKSFSLRGIEASEEHCAYCREHLTENGLGEHSSLITAAISTSRRPLYFATGLAATNNWGASVATSPQPGYVEVQGVTIRDVIADLDHIDIMHIDVQGAEEAILSDAQTLNVLGQKVKRLVIGTHSRAIEGTIFGVLKEQGWLLENEKPCRFMFDHTKDFLDMTQLDGCQIWRNAGSASSIKQPPSLLSRCLSYLTTASG